MPNQKITQSELARELQLSRQRVSQLVKAGMPTLPDGRLDRTAALKWITRFAGSMGAGWQYRSGKADISERATTLLSAAPIEPPATDAPLEPNTATAGETFEAARRRAEIARADLAEMEAERARGNSVDLAATKQLWSELGSRIQNSIMQVPDRLAVQLSRETDPRKIRLLLVTELTHALKALSQAPIPSLK